MRVLRLFTAIALLTLSLPARELKVTILATTDLHGNLEPYDYFTAQPANRGLAKIATLIRAARADNKSTVLIDCGDTIQGTPLESVYQRYIATSHLPLNLTFAGPALDRDPMMLAMNALAYDAMVVGNHEFNYGLNNLARARLQAQFPWISANIKIERRGTQRPFAPYLVKLVGGQVKVAIIGVTTPLVPDWETPEHYNGYRFDAPLDAVRAALAELKERVRPDIVIVAAHSGLDRDPQTGAVRAGDERENFVYQLASQVKGIDAIVFGHTHQQLADYKVGDTILVQPKNWGISLARLDFVVTPFRDTWKITSKTSSLVPVAAATAADPKIMEIARPYHELAEKYLNTRVADAPAELDARLARVEDSAAIDAVQQVQLAAAKADVSFASSFNPRLVIPKGPMTVRQIAALYIYDNQLYAIEGTGKMVRDALENSARFFQTCSSDCSHGPLINPQFLGFNYDMAAGVSYEIDLTHEPGDRIRNLRWHGQPLAPDQPLRVAVNNYRYGGSAGYSMFHGAKIVWKSTEEIRDLVVQYYIEHKQLPSQPDGNWRIVPDAARVELREEALAEARKATLQ